MKRLLATLVLGLIILYLIDSAFQIDGLSPAMLVENLMRFLLGFLGLGIWVAIKRKFHLKMFLIIIFVYLLSDSIFDYFTGIDDLFEMSLHDLYVFCWGALAGFVFVKCVLKKVENNNQKSI